MDRVYVNTAASCVIHDVKLKRQIHIDKKNSQSTVVWNPGVEKATKMGDFGENGWRHMVCVESANAVDNIVTIAPNKQHALEIEYRISPL